MRTRLAAFLPLLFGCSTHVGRPEAGSLRKPLSVSYAVKKNIEYAPGRTADAWIPNGTKSHPGVVLIHGGGWSSGKREHMNYIAKRLARRGYSVLNISYRLAPRHLYPAAVEDAKSALRFFRDNAETFNADPSRIGAFGYSAGAQLAAMLGVTESDFAGGSVERVGAVVAGGLPADFTRWPKSPIIGKFIGKPLPEARARWREGSPVSHVDENAPPMFLYHARRDKLVEIEQAEIMHAALQEANVHSELYAVGWWGHVTLFVLNRSAVRAGIDFLDRTL
jgi:acetyl esterase/lipase